MLNATCPPQEWAFTLKLICIMLPAAPACHGTSSPCTRALPSAGPPQLWRRKMKIHPLSVTPLRQWRNWRMCTAMCHQSNSQRRSSTWKSFPGTFTPSSCAPEPNFHTSALTLSISCSPLWWMMAFSLLWSSSLRRGTSQRPRSSAPSIRTQEGPRPFRQGECFPSRAPAGTYEKTTF